MPQEAVLFKGTREGIHIFLNDEIDFSSVIDSLERRLASSRNFFKGARIVIDTGRRALSVEQMQAVTQVLNQYDGVQLIRLEQSKPAQRLFRKAEAPMTALIIEKPVRSGQQVYHPGHVVVIGDVNPGAEVVAEGNIIVMGALRGAAHDGYQGTRASVVAANMMAPSQISIAGIWARRPDGADSSDAVGRGPEIARLRGDHIIIESY